MSIFVRRRWHAWLCGWFVVSPVISLTPTLAVGQQNAPLTLQAAIERSLKSNLELKASGFELTAQEGRIEQAGARPPLEVGVAVENAFGSGTHQSFDAAETTLTLGWLVERGARERRVDAAQAGLAVLQGEAQIKRLDVAAETARRYVNALALQQELVELRSATQLAKDTHAAVQVRVEAAKAPTVEVARAYAYLARAGINEEHAEHELETAKLRLAAMWGEGGNAAPTSITILAGDVLTLPPLGEFASLRAQLTQNPELARLVTTQRLREAEVKLADSRRRLPWQFSVGVRRFEASDDQALVAGFTMPLSNRAAAQGAIKQARAYADQSQAHAEALNVQINVELFAIYQDLAHAYTEVSGYRDEVLPRMSEALEQSRYAYERGRYSYAELSSAQREITEVRMALLEAAAKAHRYRIEIERLTGSVLTQRETP